MGCYATLIFCPSRFKRGGGGGGVYFAVQILSSGSASVWSSISTPSSIKASHSHACSIALLIRLDDGIYRLIDLGVNRNCAVRINSQVLQNVDAFYQHFTTFDSRRLVDDLLMRLLLSRAISRCMMLPLPLIHSHIHHRPPRPQNDALVLEQRRAGVGQILAMG